MDWFRGVCRFDDRGKLDYFSLFSVVFFVFQLCSCIQPRPVYSTVECSGTCFSSIRSIRSFNRNGQIYMTILPFLIALELFRAN